MALVPGGAIEGFVKARKLQPLSGEIGEDDGSIAKAYTDKGLVVWTRQDGQTRLLPFE